jgi:hypothetical protein
MGVRVRPVLAHRDESGLAGGLVVRRMGPAGPIRCTLHVRSSVAHCMYERDAGKARCIHSLAGLPLISQNGILSGQIGHGILSRRPKIGCLQRDDQRTRWHSHLTCIFKYNRVLLSHLLSPHAMLSQNRHYDFTRDNVLFQLYLKIIVNTS